MLHTQVLLSTDDVEVFLPACPVEVTQLPAGHLSEVPHEQQQQQQQQHGSKPHGSFDAAAIEAAIDAAAAEAAIVLGVQPDSLTPETNPPPCLRSSNSNSKDSSSNTSRADSISSSDHSSSIAGHPDPDSIIEHPNAWLATHLDGAPAYAETGSPMSKCLNKVKGSMVRCKAAATAALLAAKPSSKPATDSGANSNRSSDSDSGCAMGEDSCPYKLSFTAAAKPSWLLGNSSSKCFKKQQSECTTPDAATATVTVPAAAAAPNSTVSSHNLKDMWRTFSSKMSPKVSSKTQATDRSRSSSDSDGGNSGDSFGEDPSPHKHSFTAAVKPTWLLGNSSSKALTQQRKSSNTASTETPAVPAPSAPTVPVSLADTVSSRCKGMWRSLCSKLKGKGAIKGPGSWRGSQCSNRAELGSSHSISTVESSSRGGSSSDGNFAIPFSE